MSSNGADNGGGGGRGGSLLSAGMKVLTERGLGTLLTLILVGALLWGGYTLLADARQFQNQMIAESARTNEKLEQLQINHVEQKLAIDRIEKMLIEALAKATP